MKEMNWKEEAQKQVSAAGEYRIALATRRDDLYSRIDSLERNKEYVSDPNVISCVLNRISIYMEEVAWITSVLNKKGVGHGEDC